jgi:NAD(P)-dependent dehydrogenase (short-subunit alcohol dehydrogenase family)
VAVVMGAGGGIGFEAARALLWLGARVVIAEIDESSGSGAARRLRQEWPDSDVLFIATDVGDEAAVGRLVETTRAQLGPIDIVLNNAAVAAVGEAVVGSDDEFRSLVLNTNVYRLKASRLKMVLEAVDRQMASGGLSETFTLGHNLWIEHLLPQTWRGTSGWSLPADLDDPAEAGAQRDHLLHTLGNLTLTTSKLDIELSNKPWAEKLVQIRSAASLALNRDVVTRYEERWDESTIRERGGRLANALIDVWPGPERLLT